MPDTAGCSQSVPSEATGLADCELTRLTHSDARPRNQLLPAPALRFEVVVWDVVVRRETRPLIDALAGKRAGSTGDRAQRVKRTGISETYRWSKERSMSSAAS